MNRHILSSQLFTTFFALLFSLASLEVSAQTAGRMDHMMDEDTMHPSMNDRDMGYDHGYRSRGYMNMPYMSPMMGGPMMGGPMMGEMIMDYMSGLKLDSTQRDKIREIQKNMRKEHFALMEKMMDASDQLYDLYNVDKPDADKIGKAYDEIFKIKRQMIQEHVEIRNKIYDVLSKEQRERFKQHGPFSLQFGMLE